MRHLRERAFYRTLSVIHAFQTIDSLCAYLTGNYGDDASDFSASTIMPGETFFVVRYADPDPTEQGNRNLRWLRGLIIVQVISGEMIGWVGIPTYQFSKIEELNLLIEGDSEPLTG